MAYTKQSRINVADEFLRKRQARKRLIDLRESEIYQKFPRIKEIDGTLKSTGFSMFSQVIGGLSPDEAVLKIKTADDTLNAEKNSILVQAGYKSDYLTPPPECSLCNDEGYIGTNMCKCYKNALVNEAYKASNLSKHQQNTFDDFSFAWFSKQSDGVEKRSAYDNIKNIYDFCLDYAQNFGTIKESILFYGPSGTGKTFLSSCIGNKVIKDGYGVLYETSGNIFSLLDKLKFKNREEESPTFWEQITDIDLLIIDDLGTEFITEFSVGEFFRIINSRLLSGKKTIISTNFSINDLQNIYSLRVLSRILGGYRVFKFFGDDIRLQQKYK